MKTTSHNHARQNFPLNIIACPLSLSEMQDVEGGKYCHLCNHTLRDFTRSTPEEIDEAFANGAYCGIFNLAQSSRWEPASSVFYGMLSRPYKAVTASLFALTVLLAQETVAQQVQRDAAASGGPELTTVMVRLEGRPFSGATLNVIRSGSARAEEFKTGNTGIARITTGNNDNAGTSLSIEVKYRGAVIKLTKYENITLDFCPVIEITRDEISDAIREKREQNRFFRQLKRHPENYAGVYF